MTTIWQDVRIALRRLRQTPGFTAAGIATLALGLGLNSAVLTLAYALFLRPLPVNDRSRVVFVDQTLPGRSTNFSFPFSYPDFLHFRKHARSFESLAAHYSTSPMHAVIGDAALEVSGSVATASYFRVLELRPALGRFFTDEEDGDPGKHAVAVLGYDLWRSRFERNPRVLGASVRINGADFTVIGVAPEGFRGIVRGVTPNSIWIPASMAETGYRYCQWRARDCRIVNLAGRLGSGASIQDAQAEMQVLAGQLATAFPQSNAGRGAIVRAAAGVRVDEQTRQAPVVALLAAGAALVLLIASANIAGLLLARGFHRRKEIAIRLALGASRGRVIRHLLVESLALAAAGGIAGLIVSVWATELMRRFFGVGYSGNAVNLDLSLAPRVAVLGLAIAIATGILTGIAPALQATRTDALPALKDESAGAGVRRSILRDGLLVVQVAVSIVLLAGSLLVMRSFLQVHRGPGFDPDAIVLLRLRPSLLAYTSERAWTFQRETLRRLEALPGVAAASVAANPPLPRWGATQPVQPAGEPLDPSRAPRITTTYVGPRYFATLGVGVVEGREFDDRDRPDGPAVAIVNETFARQYRAAGSILGSSIVVGSRPVEIVGVVRNLQFLSVLERPEPAVYLDFWQQNRAENWSQDSRTHVRIAGDAAAVLPLIRREIAAIDPDVPVAEVSTLGERIDFEFGELRAARALLVAFGALAVVLSAIGIYAALAFAVGQRTREIAIRVALGARRSDVGALVLRRGAAIVGLGVVLGLAGASLAAPLLAHLLYGVGPRDPAALLSAPVVLGIVATAAVCLPARRAMLLDPVRALRAE